MFVVVFEVQPKPEHWDEYLDLAKFLKPELEKIDGFIDNERFGSTHTKAWVLSLSTWRDEKAIIRWRTLGVHHGVQEKGRFEVFEDYHLRVAEVTFDTKGPNRSQLQEQRFDGTEIGAAKFVTITEFTPAQGDSPGTDLASALGLPEGEAHGVIAHELFESIYNLGKMLLLVSWREAPAAGNWMPNPVPAGAIRHRGARVIRDYGMFDRREAPQYFPAVNPDKATKALAGRRTGRVQRAS